MKLDALTFGGLTASRPIVQGGMGVGVSLSSLAGAVSKAVLVPFPACILVTGKQISRKTPFVQI